MTKKWRKINDDALTGNRIRLRIDGLFEREGWFEGNGFGFMCMDEEWNLMAISYDRINGWLPLDDKGQNPASQSSTNEIEPTGRDA